MILLQSVVEIPAVAVPHTCAQSRPDRAGVTVVAVRSDPVGRDPGDHLDRLEKCLHGGHVAVLAEHYVDQRARAIDGTVEITPVPVDLDVRFVHIPALARLAASASPQIFSQRRCELGFPVANRLVAKNDAADEEHLRQVTQCELVAQAPEHNEGDDVAGILRSVQRAGTPLVELPPAGAAAGSAIALDGALTPFRNGRRAAPHTRHPTSPCQRQPYTAVQPWPTRLAGANADRTIYASSNPKRGLGSLRAFLWSLHHADGRIKTRRIDALYAVANIRSRLDRPHNKSAACRV